MSVLINDTLFFIFMFEISIYPNDFLAMCSNIRLLLPITKNQLFGNDISQNKDACRCIFTNNQSADY